MIQWPQFGLNLKSTNLPSESESSPSDQNSSPWSSGSDPWLEKHSEKMGLGLSTLRALDSLAVTNQNRKTNRAFNDGNLRLWKERMKRLGMPEETTKGEETVPDEDMQSVRVDSPDIHYHMPPSGGGVPGWLKTAAVMLGSGGIAAAGGALAYDMLTRDKEPPPAVTQPDDDDVGLNPGGLKIEVIKAP